MIGRDRSNRFDSSLASPGVQRAVWCLESTPELRSPSGPGPSEKRRLSVGTFASREICFVWLALPVAPLSTFSGQEGLRLENTLSRGRGKGGNVETSGFGGGERSGGSFADGVPGRPAGKDQ